MGGCLSGLMHIVIEKFRRNGFCSDDSDQKINFREFIRVLAHFRPINKSKPNTLNGRDEKLKCKRFFQVTNFLLQLPSQCTI